MVTSTQASSPTLPSDNTNSATDRAQDAGQREGTSIRPTKRKRLAAHTRSRGGCEACRRHKKKCDQQRPSCSRCRGGDKTCLYPSPIIWASTANVLTGNVARNGNYSSTTDAESQAEASSSRIALPASDLIAPPGNPTATTSVTAEISLAGVWNAGNIDATSTAGGISAANDRSDAAYLPNNVNPFDQLDFAPNIAATGPCSQDPWSFDGDAFLQAMFAMSQSQPATHISPETSTLTNTGNSRRHTSGPLAVPLDCDPALWSFFVDSSRWEETEPGDDDGSLLEYYLKFASFGVVIQDGSARQFYQDLASRAKVEKGRALMHAVLCLSAQHLSNKARTEDDRAKMTRYKDLSAEHRSQALHLLRVAAADQSNVDADVLPAVMALLILATILKGEPGIIPSFLDRTKNLIDKAVTASLCSHAASKDSALLPSVSALHSMYTAFHSLSAQRQIDLTVLFPQRDGRAIWSERAQDVLETVTGMRKDVFMLLLKANALVLEYQTVTAALARANDDDDELSMMRMELQARGSSMESDLEDDEAWRHQYSHGVSARIQLGHGCCRLATRVMILVDILDLDMEHLRVARLIQAFADLLDTCEPRLEVGLTWPYIIVASCAPTHLRPRMSAFIKRAQWKGSAMPLIAETVVEEVWQDRDASVEGRTWREVILAKGSPVII